MKKRRDLHTLILQHHRREGKSCLIAVCFVGAYWVYGLCISRKEPSSGWAGERRRAVEPVIGTIIRLWRKRTHTPLTIESRMNHHVSNFPASIDRKYHPPHLFTPITPNLEIPLGNYPLLDYLFLGSHTESNERISWFLKPTDPFASLSRWLPFTKSSTRQLPL